MSSLFSSFLSFSVCLFAISKCDEKEHRKERITVSLARKTALKYKMRFYHRIKVETNKNRSNNMFNACVRERETKREKNIEKPTFIRLQLEKKRFSMLKVNHSLDTVLYMYLNEWYSQCKQTDIIFKNPHYFSYPKQ